MGYSARANERGAAHTVPLTPEILALLQGLPRFTGGDFLFSTTGAKGPISGFSKAKAKLDSLCERTSLKECHSKTLSFTISVEPAHAFLLARRGHQGRLPASSARGRIMVAIRRPGRSLRRCPITPPNEKGAAHRCPRDLWEYVVWRCSCSSCRSSEHFTKVGQAVLCSELPIISCSSSKQSEIAVTHELAPSGVDRLPWFTIHLLLPQTRR